MADDSTLEGKFRKEIEASGGGGGGGGTSGTDSFTLNIPTTGLDDGDFITTRYTLDGSQDLTVDAAGVQDTNNSVPTGVSVQVVDESTSTVVTSVTSKRVSDIGDTVTAGNDMAVKMENLSGNSASTSCFVDFQRL